MLGGIQVYDHSFQLQKNKLLEVKLHNENIRILKFYGLKSLNMFNGGKIK